MFTSTRRRPRPSVRSPKLPALPSVPRATKGYSREPITVRGQGLPGAAKFTPPEPAGDPPDDFEGTRPEWAIYWATQKLGYVEGIDFTFQARLRGVEISYYSTIDFLFNYPDKVGIEIQGSFWHSRGEDRAKDLLRKIQFASEGIEIVYIDEDKALNNPIFYLKDALKGISHSEISIDD